MVKTIIVGDGKYSGKSLKIRFTSDQTKDSFLKKMSDEFGKDYTKEECFYENGLSQENLINVNWTGMLPFENDPNEWGIIEVKVETQEQFDWFKNNTKNPRPSKNIHSCWYPDKPQEQFKGCYWKTDSDPIPTRHPIYIISKGRHSVSPTRMTWTHLNEMDIPYRVVVETQEFDLYKTNSGLPEEKLLKLPEQFCNLGQGGIPVRNWVWEHSKSEGHTHHWIMDDNLNGFHRLHKNCRLKIKSGIFFNLIEDFMDKYHNLYQTGLGYTMDNPEIDKSRKCSILNTKVYSCILIRNDLDEILEEKWRGTYNEDVDLSLRILKKGLPTVQFQCFLSNKEKTLGMGGGNTDSIYKGDGLQKKVDSLMLQHPDVVKQTNKRHTDGRPHHTVDYRPFKQNKLILLPQKKWKYTTYPELSLKEQ